MSTLLCFRVRAVTQINQTVKICGNIPELGNWNPKNALTLTTNENVYPMWINQNYLNLQSVDHYVHLEFKCIIVSGENQYWENTPNRIMKLDCIKLIIFCTFGASDVSIVPLKKYSTDSLNLDEDEVANVRKVHLGGQLNPFESDFNSSSDPESDFQSLLRSRESQTIQNGLDQSADYYKDFENQKAINNSLREIEIPKLEMVSYSSGSDIVKKFPITNWGEYIKKQFLEEKDIYSNSRKSSRKSSMLSENIIKTVSSNNLLNLYEHQQLIKLYKQENTHKLIVISFFARQQQKQQPTSQDVLSPSQFFNEQQRNQLTRIVKKLAQNPKNTVIVIGCDHPFELDVNMFGKYYSTYLIANKGRYVCQAQKNNEFQDLKDVYQESWDKIIEMIRSLQDNYDYISFTYNSDCVEIDCSIIRNEVQILIKPKQIKQCVLQEICDCVVAYVGLNTFIQVDQNQNQVRVSMVYQDIGIIIQTIVSHEIQTKGPIQFQLQVVYNASHDDDLFQCLEEINKHKNLRTKRAFSTILKNIYLVPVSKDSKFSNIRCNSQFEMIRLLDKMTSEVSCELMVEDQQELMYY